MVNTDDYGETWTASRHGEGIGYGYPTMIGALNASTRSAGLGEGVSTWDIDVIGKPLKRSSMT